MSDAHDLLMLGPVGTPLEDVTDADPNESWWIGDDGEYWTVERIGRHVYTFSLDDMWTDPAPAPRGGRHG